MRADPLAVTVVTSDGPAGVATVAQAVELRAGKQRVLGKTGIILRSGLVLVLQLQLDKF